MIIKELNKFRIDHGVIIKESCSKEDDKKYRELIKNGKSLPSNIIEDPSRKGWFYNISKESLDDKDLSEYIGFKTLDSINYIKNTIVLILVVNIIVAIKVFL